MAKVSHQVGGDRSVGALRPRSGFTSARSGEAANSEQSRSINLQVAHPEKLQLVKGSKPASAPLKAAPKTSKYQA